MLRAVDDRELDRLLSRVSRSFYLSLAVLPPPLRQPLSVAYLVARAADTIADTETVQRGLRRELLSSLRKLLDNAPDPAARGELSRVVRRAILEGAPAAERALIDNLDGALAALDRLPDADRALTQRVLDTLCKGMERDLERFDGATLTALADVNSLDDHCYAAAGCVGEYWTAMTALHVPAAVHMSAPDLVARGVRLGKALQLVNVLRDAPADLAAGRCYLPLSLLAREGLDVNDLVNPARRARARPILDELRAMALAHVDAAWGYVMALPRLAPRLRLACVWPLWIGLATLARLTTTDALAPGTRVKIPRREVYAIVGESTALILSDRMLARAHARRRRAAEAR